MAVGGYAGEILRVDLTSGEMERRSTSDYADRFLGGRGIAAKIYWDEVPPEVGALEPENRLIFATGPLGGIPIIEKINRKKAKLLYDIIDKSEGFYKGHAKEGSRSLMNVTFNLPSPELEEKCIIEGSKKGLIGLKGHRSIGGMRASIYNAMEIEGVQALVEFLKEFQDNYE